MTEEIKEVLQVEADGIPVESEKVLYFKGEELHLRYSLWSLIKLQEVHGMKIEDLTEESETDFSTIVKLVWAGLQDSYEDIQYKEVAQAFEIGDLEALTAELNRAMSSSTALGKPAIAAGLASA